MRSPHVPSSRRARAFSLTELIVVIAILMLMAALGIPAYNSISQGRNFTRAATDISALLELARTEAVARQTYVWVGLEPVTKDQNATLVLGAVYSRDGTGTNIAAGNLAPLSKIVRFVGVAPVSWKDLRNDTKALYTNATPSSVLDNKDGISFTLSEISFSGGQTLTFTPRGEALLKGGVGPDDGYPEAIDISFRQANGTVVRAGADEAALVVEGATGTVKTVRVK
jgi:type II secretory pathway pseudopilin PulG